MTRPRKALISLTTTPYYHVTSRCVRQAFLFGKDPCSGRDYEHRRQWVIDRIRLLSSLFAIDICAYAVMGNHYHLVIKLCPDQLDEPSDDDVLERWCTMFRGPPLVQRYRAGEALSAAEMVTLANTVQIWRNKLSSLSWFMRCLNQAIAHQANREDGCTGKFWECRFTTQALKSEEALLSCMAYVDLNPVRADIASTPETSEYTSIRERIMPTFQLEDAVENQVRNGGFFDFKWPLKPLLHFAEAKGLQEGIPYAYPDYLNLVDWTGRVIRQDKRGAIDSELPSILERLGLTLEQWAINTTRFEAIHDRRFNRVTAVFDTG